MSSTVEFFSDALFEQSKSSLLLLLVWVKHDSVSVFPLAVGENVQVLEETFHPAASIGVSCTDAFVVPTLCQDPMLGRDAFQQILPAGAILGSHCSTDFRGKPRRQQCEITSVKLVQAMVQSFDDVWASVNLVKESVQFGQVFGPGAVGIFSRACQDVECVFRGATMWTGISSLFAPC